MDLEHVVGSIITEQGPQPFILHVKSGRIKLGTYAAPEAAQAALSVIQLQRMAQRVHERANVSFAQVRVGQYQCPSCSQWIEVTQPGTWAEATCAACAASAEAPPSEAPSPEAPPSEAAAATPSQAIEMVLHHAGESLIEKALEVAMEAHRGQRDKAGAPYLLHPLRLMGQMDTPEAMMAAVLHDVVEDSAWTLAGLREAGFPEVVVDAVDHLTRRPGETYEAFIERAAQHPLARRVKQADLEDNMDVRRLAALTEDDVARLTRYQEAWRRLVDGA